MYGPFEKQRHPTGRTQPDAAEIGLLYQGRDNDPRLGQRQQLHQRYVQAPTDRSTNRGYTQTLASCDDNMNH